MYILGDIGGTNSRVAVCLDGETIKNGNIVRIPTLKDFQEGIFVLKDQMQRLLRGQRCNAAAIGFTGFLNPERTEIVTSILNHKWEKKNIIRIMSDFLGTSQVYLEDDAILAALGEAVYGAGQGYNIVAFITVSTGLGGARAINGQVDRVKYSFEPADQIIRAEYAFLTQKEDYEKGRPNVAGYRVRERLGVDAQDVPQEHQIWEEYARSLAITLFNMTLFWCPDIIVLGGPMIRNTPGIPLKKVREYTEYLVRRTYPDCPKIVGSCVTSVH
jgi:predicted NBD/HSP70 family sugar kinase